MTPGELKINDLLLFKNPPYLSWVIWMYIATDLQLQVKKKKKRFKAEQFWFGFRVRKSSL